MGDKIIIGCTLIDYYQQASHIRGPQTNFTVSPRGLQWSKTRRDTYLLLELFIFVQIFESISRPSPFRELDEQCAWLSGPTSWDPTASSAQFSAPAQAKPAKHKQPPVNPLRPFSGFSQGSVDSTGTLVPKDVRYNTLQSIGCTLRCSDFGIFSHF